MPLLPPEPALFPDTLFDAAPADDHEGRLWYVLHTKPRQEKSLARHLRERGVPFYLPLIERRSRSRGRLLTSYLPLFGGYLFLLGRREERLVALSTNRVVRTLDVPDQRTLWKDLTQIYKLIAAGKPVTPEDKIGPGALVEIREGPLVGLRGKVLQSASGRRFIVQVDFIQKGASVLLDDFVLKRAD